MNFDNHINWFCENAGSCNVHGKNILAKLKKNQKLNPREKEELTKVVPSYKDWYKKNTELDKFNEPDIEIRVNWLNQYKKLIENISFTAQSKLHSTVIEEFLYFLFKDLLSSLNEESVTPQKTNMKTILLGGIRAYSNLYFAPENYSKFLNSPNMKINEKDQDFSIYRAIQLKADNENKKINVPIVSIECKTYIDKTMLEGSIATAEKIKYGNPYCKYIVVTDTYDVSYNVDPAYSRIDQIYVLKKQKRRSSVNHPIDNNVVIDLFNFVSSHLQRNWSNIENKLNKEGKII